MPEPKFDQVDDALEQILNRIKALEVQTNTNTNKLADLERLTGQLKNAVESRESKPQAI